MPTTLIDSNVFIAAARPSESLHAAATEALDAYSAGGLATPVTILAETMSFIGARLGISSQRLFWDGFMRSGVELVPIDVQLLEHARRIDDRYEDCGFGFADCTLLAAADLLGATRVLSFDSRLRAFRPSSGGHLEIVP